LRISDLTDGNKHNSDVLRNLVRREYWPFRNLLRLKILRWGRRRRWSCSDVAVRRRRRRRRCVMFKKLTSLLHGLFKIFL